MSRYIDADKLVTHLKDELEGCKQPVGGRACGKSIAYGTALGLTMAISFAETLPTADVVEVVRCRDCKRFLQMETSPSYDGKCLGYGYLVEAKHYCSYGEMEEK